MRGDIQINSIFDPLFVFETTTELMKIYRLYTCLVLAFAIVSTVMNAQVNETRWCGQPAVYQKIWHSHADAPLRITQAEQELEEHTQNYIANRENNGVVYTIPVVFHVVHNNGPENISDDQIRDAVRIMTRDFRKQNPDIVNVVAQFASITADCEIEFKLAGKDPNGNCHKGINRVVSTLTYDGYNDALKQLINWPRNKYLNIWVVADIEGASGFSNYPSSVSSAWDAYLDGIVVRYDYVGSIGASNNARSRTLTHEAGHWLNLRHLWGNSNEPGLASNCNLSDDVADTPQTTGHTSCNLNASTCDGTLDNVQNYMEYSFCTNMFTQGQKDRMRAALTSSVAQRNNLITDANLIATGVMNPVICLAQFRSDKVTICAGETVQFFDLSYHGVTSWSWNFGDGNSLSGSNAATDQNPVHQYSEPGVYAVSLTVSNANSNQQITMPGFITVLEPGAINSNFSEGFEGEWPNSFFSVYNEDAGLTYEITPTAAYSGSKSLKLRNHGNTVGNNRDVLYTATFDLSNATNAALSYKWAYTNKLTATADQLIISFSGDCGNTWDIRRVRDGMSNFATAPATNSQFTPSGTNQWNGETLSIGFDTWLTDRFQARFEFIGKGGNNFYLDDINLTADFGVGVQEVKPIHALRFYPNPSSETMTLDFVMPVANYVDIAVYNATGQLCQQVCNQTLAPGKHFFQINAQSAGLYHAVIRQGNHVSTEKIIFE